MSSQGVIPSSGLSLMQDTGPFQVNERCNAFSKLDQRIYEAKVLKAEFRQLEVGVPGQWHYFVHYAGWNKKYDEWVPQNHVYKFGDPLPEVPVVQTMVPKAQKKTSAAATGAAGGGAKFGKKKVVGEAPAASLDMAMYAAGMGLPLLQLELDMPPLLKKALIDEYDAIVSELKLTPLPRTPNVINVLQGYVQHAIDAHGPFDNDQRRKDFEAELRELEHGLRAYFDKALPAMLLYRTERHQAHNALQDGRAPCAVYGAEHLVRLLLKLPEILPTFGLTELQLQQTAYKLQDLLSWMASSSDALILSKDKYLDPEPEQ